MKERKLASASSAADTENTVDAGFLKRVITLGIVVVLVMAMLLFLWSQACYAVAVDGEVVGTVRNEEEVDAIIENVEESVSDILGYEYHVTADVELTGTLGSEEDHIAEAVLSSVEEIGQMYILEVDGVAVAAAETEQELRDAVDQITEIYSVGKDSTVSFDNEITISYAYVPLDSVSETADIVKYLDPANGSEHALTVRTVSMETYQETVPFDYEVRESDELYDDVRVVHVEGVDGVADVTYKVEYLNGMAVACTESSYIIVQQPVTEVVTVGTLEKPEWVSYGEYIWPCGGWVSSYFGGREVEVGSSYHRGLDIAEYIGAEIYAADGGTVTYAGYWGDYGLMVEIEHDNGEVTRYAHCHSLCVNTGEKVARGEVIGRMGDTGNVSGVHLHFEIRVDGVAINPLTRLP